MAALFALQRLSRQAPQIAYTQWERIADNFSEEEQRMEEAGYKGLQEQKLQHAVYLNNIAELKHQASLPKESGTSYELSVTATQIVVDWIVNHIMKADKLFGVYLRQLNA